MVSGTNVAAVNPNIMNFNAKTLGSNKVFINSLHKVLTESTKSLYNSVTLKQILLKEKEDILKNNPFLTYKDISQYNNLSPSKQFNFQKVHQYYLKQIVIHKNISKNYGSLCWMCLKPCSKTNMCSWIKEEVPVDNWKAEPSTIINNSEIVHTYNILDCPKFHFYNRSYELSDIFTIISYFNHVSTRTVFRNPKKQIKRYNELFPFASLSLFVDPCENEYEDEEEDIDSIVDLI